MAAHHESMRSQFPPPPSNPRSLRVDPFAPLPTSSPLPQHQGGESAAWPEEVQMNSVPTAASMPRTSSRKRRVSGAGSGSRAQVQSYSQPPAPEVPRAPPVSYRGPYAGNGMSPTASNPTSFAARARGFADDEETLPTEAIHKSETTAKPVYQNRHASVPRSSREPRDNPSDGHLEPDFSQQSPTISGVPIQQSTLAQVPNRTQVPDILLPQPEASLFKSESYGDTATTPVRSNTKRISAKTADPRTEWAPDRSPLQKLEVKLNDISKEEKRARVEKAEQRLKERKAEEERQRKLQGVESATEYGAGEEIRGDASGQAKSIRPPDPDSRQSETRPRTRAVAPAYVEDIDQQHLERQQPQLIQIASNTSAQGPQKATPNVLSPQEQAGRGVRFHNGYRGEETDTVMPGDRQGSVQSKDPLEVHIQSTRPQQKILQHQMAKGARDSKEVPTQQQALYSSKVQPSDTTDDPAEYGGPPDPVPRDSVRVHNQAIEYEVPPQTAAGIEARQKVGFGGDPAGAIAAPAQRKHHLSKILHHGQKTVPTQTSGFETQPRHLDEWRQGGTARLTAADLINEPDSSTAKNAWWEGRSSGSQAKTSAKLSATGVDRGPRDGYPAEDYSPERKSFNPPLYLKCGPLLRYTGLKRDRLQNPRTENGTSTIERESWRGSVMVVTVDAESQYNPGPSLRLFPEPIDLLPPPPQQVNGDSGDSLPSEYVDPIAGLPKLTRTGTIVYVKPAEDLEQEADLSRFETDDGLFEETRTANVPTSYGMPNPRLAQNAPAQSGNLRAYRGDRAGSARGQSVKGVRLHAERGCTFWRFNLEVELTARQMRVAYSINNSPSIGFWVPARGQSMNIMFHSCNGFSMNVNPASFSGPDPLWRDVLNSHQSRPFHVMIGGGDQIYNDAVMSQTKLFQQWLGIKNPIHKHEAKFSWEMQEELEHFYLERYSMWFSQGLFGMANSQIPMINMWDDHDIIDGFGSYPHHFMSTRVFCGLGAVAFKYYMLFQQQSVPGESPADEPSWLLGAAPGPYINELSRSIFLSLGKHVSFLALDCRTERMREEVVSEATYDLVFDRCRREIIEGETKHLVVLLGVPIAYPRLAWLENLLTSRVMDPVKALGRAGMLTGFLNKFDGGVEILDDLDDHWTAKNHKSERRYFVQELQELASEKSVRVTILGGDVHLAAVGQFFSNPKLKIPKDRDHRYMANVISSAIVNTPPPEMMGDILNRRNKTHHLDYETDENMIPMFTHDVDGKPRNNKRLLPRRNWCSIREYQPGSTPPPTPSDVANDDLGGDSPQRPGVLQRTLSLTRADMKPGNLIRRLSQRDNQVPADYPLSNEYRTSPTAVPSSPEADGYFSTPKRQSAIPSSKDGGATRFSSAPLPRPGNFHRRPTNMSFKAVKKGGVVENDSAGHINLEDGLDIVLNCEVSQKDPAGITVPYRLLIPALLYEGHEDFNDAPYRKKSLLQRLGSFRGGRRRSLAGNQGQGNWGKSQESFTQTESHSEMSDRQLQDDAMGRGGAFGRLKRSLSSRGRHNVSQGGQEDDGEGRVEGMGLVQRRPSVAKKDISAPQLQRDTVSAEAIISPQRLASTARAAPNPQRQSRGPTSTVAATAKSSQPSIPQRQSSKVNRVEGMGVFPRRQPTTTRAQPQNPQQSPLQSDQQSQPLGLRMMEDRAEQQRQQSDDFERAENGYPGRRPSKLDRILGRDHTSDQATAGRGPSFAARDAARRDEEYSTEGDYSDDYSYEESIEQQEGLGAGKPGTEREPAKGYGGIEAYKAGKGWKRLLGAKGKALVG